MRGVVLSAVLLCSATASGETPSWRVDLGKSRLVVEVRKAGAFSPALHDHAFEPERWTATLAFEPSSPATLQVEVVVEAASLHDHQPKLSRADEVEVDATAVGPKGLDAANYPDIRFRSSAFKADPPGESLSGTLSGLLTLHGRTGPLDLPVTVSRDGDALVAKGAVTLRQSAFGMEPYSRFLGAIAVRDEVTVRFEVRARREAALPSPPAGP